MKFHCYEVHTQNRYKATQMIYFSSVNRLWTQVLLTLYAIAAKASYWIRDRPSGNPDITGLNCFTCHRTDRSYGNAMMAVLVPEIYVVVRVPWRTHWTPSYYPRARSLLGWSSFLLTLIIVYNLESPRKWYIQCCHRVTLSHFKVTSHF